MKIIKLSAIDSTNTFLKELAQNSALENFTTVVTQNQTQGRGQHEKKWISEPFKNLTFSTFIQFENLKITQKKYLNFAVSLALQDVLKTYNIPKIAIKWPNDIMSVHKKICGILIENTFKGNTIKNAIIGIGLNVNQTLFPAALSHVTSLKKITNTTYDLNIVLNEIIKAIKIQINNLNSGLLDELEEQYLKSLYKKNTPTMFKNSQGELFMGIISGISNEGNLLVELEDESLKEFKIKEIAML